MFRIAQLILFLTTAAALFGQSAQDSFLVKPYLQYATQEGISILWETTAPATTTVEYGEAQPRAQAPNLSQSISLDGRRLLHEVRVEGLKPATKYLYRVRSTTSSGRELLSEVYTFQTAVPEDQAVFFALVGDSQYNSGTPWAWGVIADLVWRDRPQFIIHAGDLVDQGTKKTDWVNHFFPNGHVAMSRYPMYTVLGNHEQDAQHYYDYMVNPEPEYYYTFHYGNVQFFMIDTNRDVQEGSEQYDWLEWQLARSTATWKIVVHHHPPYSSEADDHGDTYIGASTYQTQSRNLVPLYEAYGVDFCLFGHTHVYERSWPLFEDAVNLQNGVIYINSGGAGGFLEDFDPTRSWFTQELQTGHHYCTFAIFDQHLVFKAIDHEGRLFDTFQMTKEEDGGGGRAGMRQPPAPRFDVDRLIFEDQTRVALSALDSSYQLYYTLDGSEPNQQSMRYTGPVTITESTSLRARAYTSDGRASRVVERTFTQMSPRPAVQTGDTEPGLSYRYYEGDWDYLPSFDALQPTASGVAATVTEDGLAQRPDRFGLVLEGYVELPATDTYTFYTRSDDGSKLYIDGELVVDNDGQHGAFWEYGATILEAGKHRLRIEYFESSGSQMLRAGLLDADLGKVPFHPGQLSH